MLLRTHTTGNTIDAGPSPWVDNDVMSHFVKTETEGMICEKIIDFDYPSQKLVGRNNIKTDEKRVN